MTISKGWISLHRKIMDNPLYFSEPFTRIQAWIDMLLIANHADGFFYIRGNKVTVLRGQVGMGSKKLAERWKWSRGKATRFLNDMESQGQIVQQKNPVTSIISIVNYDMYQQYDTTDRTANDTADGHQIGQQTDINNKNNKNNNDNNISTNVDCPNIGDSDSQKARKINYKELLDLYHSICVSLPKVQKLTDSRKNKIRIRIREIEKQFKDTRYTIVLNDLFSKMESSDFMKGSNTRNWRASLDWLFENSENWVKVLEGKYDNRSDNLRDQEFVNNLLGKGGCQTYIIPDDGPKSEYKYINGKLTLVVD